MYVVRKNEINETEGKGREGGFVNGCSVQTLHFLNAKAHVIAFGLAHRPPKINCNAHVYTH